MQYASALGIEVKIEPVVLADVLLAIEINPVEISGFAKVEKIGNIFTIRRGVTILKQINRISETHLDPEAHALWIYEVKKGGGNIGEYRLWWHSHVRSDAYFSAIDETAINTFKDNDWIMSLVGNKFGAILIRLDIFKPKIKRGILVDNIKFTEKTAKEDLRNLMLARKDAMLETILRNTTLGVSKKPFETILSGVFGDG